MSTKAIVLLPWLVLCVALAPCFSQSNPSHQQQIEVHSRQAAEYLKENRPDLAVPEFRAIIALDPNNVDARGNLRVVLFFQGAYTDAIPQFRAALKVRPTLWKIQALLGIAEKRTRDVKAALGDLERHFQMTCKYRGIDVHCGPRGLKGSPDNLYHNNGDGTFADVSKKAGVSDLPNSFGLTVVGKTSTMMGISN
jgi:tetratricopeptide repeat protein